MLVTATSRCRRERSFHGYRPAVVGLSLHPTPLPPPRYVAHVDVVSARYAPLYYHCIRHSAILSVTDRGTRFCPRHVVRMCRCAISSHPHARCTRNETQRTTPCTGRTVCLSRSRVQRARANGPTTRFGDSGRGIRRFPNGRRGSYVYHERHERTMLFVGKGQVDAPLFRRGLRLREFSGAIARCALALSVVGNLDRSGCCVPLVLGQEALSALVYTRGSSIFNI